MRKSVFVVTVLLGVSLLFAYPSVRAEERKLGDVIKELCDAVNKFGTFSKVKVEIEEGKSVVADIVTTARQNGATGMEFNFEFKVKDKLFLKVRQAFSLQDLDEEEVGVEEVEEEENAQPQASKKKRFEVSVRTMDGKETVTLEVSKMEGGKPAKPNREKTDTVSVSLTTEEAADKVAELFKEAIQLAKKK